MKEKSSLKNIFIILLILLICVISFGGIVIKNKNTFTNIIPEYKTGMNFAGKRVFKIKPDDTVNKEYYDKEGNKVEESSIEEDKKEEYDIKEIPINSSEILNKDNYDKVKKIVEKRLDILGVKEFEVSVDYDDGSVTVSIPDDNDANFVISQITETGKFKIIDAQDEDKILLSEENVKNVKTRLVNQYSQYYAVLTINFDKQGTKILQDISNEYRGQTINIESDEEKSDEEKEESQTATKQVKLMLDDQTIISQYFTEEVKDGKIELTIGNSSINNSEESLKNYLRQGRGLASFIQTEDMPIIYIVDSDDTEGAKYSQNEYNIFFIVILAISLILVVFACIKYKKSGLLLMISEIGFVATLLLIIRLANVFITETGVIAIVLSGLLSYIFIIRLLNANKKDSKLSKVALNTLFVCIPIYIISIICSLAKFLLIQNYLFIESFGMILFYGVSLMPIYHSIFTRILIKSK